MNFLSPSIFQTPGAGLDPQSGEWCTTDIEVKIRTHDDIAFAGQSGYIRTVVNGNCSVFLPKEDRVVTVLTVNLDPVKPKAGEYFKMIYGDDRETTGIVVSADAKEATVKVQDKIQILPIDFLCKMEKKR